MTTLKVFIIDICIVFFSGSVPLPPSVKYVQHIDNVTDITTHFSCGIHDPFNNAIRTTSEDCDIFIYSKYMYVRKII